MLCVDVTSHHAETGDLLTAGSYLRQRRSSRAHTCGYNNFLFTAVTNDNRGVANVNNNGNSGDDDNYFRIAFII